MLFIQYQVLTQYHDIMILTWCRVTNMVSWYHCETVCHSMSFHYRIVSYCNTFCPKAFVKILHIMIIMSRYLYLSRRLFSVQLSIISTHSNAISKHTIIILSLCQVGWTLVFKVSICECYLRNASNYADCNFSVICLILL